MNKKRVLITGASGFVGLNVLEYLLKKTDWNFTCVSTRYTNGIPVKNPRVHLIVCDLANNMPNVGDFDYILNLASESSVQNSIKWPITSINNNILIALNMLEYARVHKPKVFLQFSTNEVFGFAGDEMLPANPYAASKAAQEVIAISYWNTYGVPVVITNSSNIVGKNQGKDKFVPTVISKIKAQEEVLIYEINGLPGRRYWNPVDNIADALKFILTECNPMTTAENFRPNRYSLSGGEELDNLEMATLISGLLNIPLKYKLISGQAIRPGYHEYGVREKSLEKLGWKPVQTLREGLATWVS